MDKTTPKRRPASEGSDENRQARFKQFRATDDIDELKEAARRLRRIVSELRSPLKV